MQARPNSVPEYFSATMLIGMDWHDRLNAALKAKSWSIPDLARSMGHPDDEAVLNRLYKYTSGDVKNPRGDWMGRIATAIGESEQFLRYGKRDLSRNGARKSEQATSSDDIRIQGEVAAGVWRSTDGADVMAFEESGLPPDPRFSARSQFDLIVRGTSINRFAKDGDRLRVVSIDEREPSDGDLVIVERDRGGIVETTAKRLHRSSSPPQLRPDSDDPSWQPIPLDEDDGVTVRIVGSVLFAYRPA